MQWEKTIAPHNATASRGNFLQSNQKHVNTTTNNNNNNNNKTFSNYSNPSHNFNYFADQTWSNGNGNGNGNPTHNNNTNNNGGGNSNFDQMNPHTYAPPFNPNHSSIDNNSFSMISADINSVHNQNNSNDNNINNNNNTNNHNHNNQFQFGGELSSPVTNESIAQLNWNNMANPNSNDPFYQQDTTTIILQQCKRIKLLEEQLHLTQLQLCKTQQEVELLQKEKEKKAQKSRYWTEEEHQKFLEGLERHGAKDVKAISAHVSTKNPTQVRTHAQKYFLKLKREKERQEKEKREKIINIKIKSEGNNADNGNNNNNNNNNNNKSTIGKMKTEGKKSKERSLSSDNVSRAPMKSSATAYMSTPQFNSNNESSFMQLSSSPSSSPVFTQHNNNNHNTNNTNNTNANSANIPIPFTNPFGSRSAAFSPGNDIRRPRSNSSKKRASFSLRQKLNSVPATLGTEEYGKLLQGMRATEGTQDHEKRCKLVRDIFLPYVSLEEISSWINVFNSVAASLNQPADLQQDRLGIKRQRSNTAPNVISDKFYNSSNFVPTTFSNTSKRGSLLLSQNRIRSSSCLSTPVRPIAAPTRSHSSGSSGSTTTAVGVVQNSSPMSPPQYAPNSSPICFDQTIGMDTNADAQYNALLPEESPPLESLPANNLLLPSVLQTSFDSNGWPQQQQEQQ